MAARKKAAPRKKPAKKKPSPPKLLTMNVSDHHGKVTTVQSATEHDAIAVHTQLHHGAKPIRYVSEPRAGRGNRWLVYFDDIGMLTCRVVVER